MPIKLVDTSSPSGFFSPAFQTDNNLVGIGEDVDQPSVSRDLLRTHKAMIAQDFERNEMESDKLLVPRNQSKVIDAAMDSFVVDVTQVTQKPILDRLAAIYAALLNLNLTTNILNEISYLLNVLNADYARCKAESVDEKAAQWELALTNGQNCVYFSGAVLRFQTHILLMLDVTTLRVLLQNDRLLKCDPSTHELLHSTFDKRLLKSTNDLSRRTLDNSSSMNVSYQQDIDTKNNFPTTREFSAFNKQRDLFYQILR